MSSVMRTYTGPLPNGETVTVTCPAWCKVDHTDDSPIDIFHRSGYVVIEPPEDLYAGAVVPQMNAHLVAPAVPQSGEGPNISLDLDDRLTQYTELNAAQADDLLAQLDAYRAGLQWMRDQLAASGKAAAA